MFDSKSISRRFHMAGIPEKKLRRDPLPVFSFLVDVGFDNGEEAKALFKSVSGLRFDTAVVPVSAGGINDTTFKLVGATDWQPLVLRQGFTADSQLIKWRQEWMYPAMSSSSKGKRTRASGMITQLDTSLEPVARWSFERGWPCKWDISEFDASKSELAIETLEIAHEGLTFFAVTPKPPPMKKSAMQDAEDEQAKWPTGSGAPGQTQVGGTSSVEI